MWDKQKATAHESKSFGGTGKNNYPEEVAHTVDKWKNIYSYDGEEVLSRNWNIVNALQKAVKPVQGSLHITSSMANQARHSYTTHSDTNTLSPMWQVKLSRRSWTPDYVHHKSREKHYRKQWSLLPNSWSFLFMTIKNSEYYLGRNLAISMYGSSLTAIWNSKPHPGLYHNINQRCDQIRR